jgi:GT2 family glycosyltransferase
MIRHSTRKGPAAARNTGARSAAGEYLAFTDDDCCPNPDWLAELCMASKKHPGKLLGGRVENGEPENNAAKFNQALVNTLQELTFEKPNWFFTSNNLCVEAQLFHGLGGFDELFLEAAGEDREFCLRWRLSGRTMSAIQSAVVYHFHPQSMRGFWAMHQRYGIAARKLHAREPGMRIPTALLVATLLRRGFWWATALSQAAIAYGYFLSSSAVHSGHRSERSRRID